MKINLNQLRCFYLAAKFKSISKAAESLFVTPSAVTMQIKKFENWAGVRLLVREGNSIALAPGAGLIFTQAEKIFQEAEVMESLLEKMMNYHKDEVVIGAHHILAKYILPNLVVIIKRMHPNISVKMEMDNVPRLAEKLRNNEIDFVISASIPEEKNIKTIPLFSEDLLLISLKGSKIIRKKRVTTKEISSIPLLLQERNVYVVDQFMKSKVLEPTIAMDNISADVIKQFILRDVGAAILMEFTVQDELERDIFQEIIVEEGLPTADFSLAYCHDNRVSPEIQNLVKSLKSYSFSREELI